MKGRFVNMNLKPLQDRIIAKRLEGKDKTMGGIIIPEAAKEPPLDAEVVAVGDGVVMEGGEIRPLQVNVGDKILFGKYAGTEINVEGEKLLMLRESDVLGIIEE